MNPSDVNPHNFNVEEIIYTSQDGYFSIVIGTGDGGNIYEHENRRFAMRWNGKTEAQKGFPTSNGHPMWFQLPNDITEILSVLINNSTMKVK